MGGGSLGMTAISVTRLPKTLAGTGRRNARPAARVSERSRQVSVVEVGGDAVLPSCAHWAPPCQPLALARAYRWPGPRASEPSRRGLSFSTRISSGVKWTRYGGQRHELRQVVWMMSRAAPIRRSGACQPVMPAIVICTESTWWPSTAARTWRIAPVPGQFPCPGSRTEDVTRRKICE